MMILIITSFKVPYSGEAFERVLARPAHGSNR